MGCDATLNTKESYNSAGFKDEKYAKAYLEDFRYYQHKLTDRDWDLFYKRFPDYWKNVQDAKLIDAEYDFIRSYTPLAFKWNTNRRMKKWSESTIRRLKEKKVNTTDNIFKIIYSLGVPSRAVWNNNHEILIYNSDKSVLLKNDRFYSYAQCKGCERYNDVTKLGLTDDEVIDKLKNKYE